MQIHTLDKIVIHIIAGFVTLWVTGFIIFVGSVCMIEKPVNEKEKSDAIVVLTGGAKRVEEGVKLFKEKAAPQLFISGVHLSVTPAELVPNISSKKRQCCVTLGRKAGDTFNNATETKEWIDKKNYETIHLVTAHYHIVRSAALFRLMMPELKIQLYPVFLDKFSIHDWRFWDVCLKEYSKLYLGLIQTLLYKVVQPS